MNAVATSLQPITRQCKDCEKLFVFEVTEQMFFAEKGLTNTPRRCKDCRHKRKQNIGHPATGVVTRFSAKNGWGFIALDNPDPSGKDAFVHYGQINVEGSDYRNLAKGQRVEFILVRGTKGPMATNVRVIEQEAR